MCDDIPTVPPPSATPSSATALKALALGRVEGVDKGGGEEG